MSLLRAETGSDVKSVTVTKGSKHWPAAYSLLAAGTDFNGTTMDEPTGGVGGGEAA